MKVMLLASGVAMTLLLVGLTPNFALAATTTNSMEDCETAKACQPWDVTRACTRGQRMDIRFSLGVAHSRDDHDASNGTASSGAGTIYENVRPYYFCAVVDQLSAFLLNGSAAITSTVRPLSGSKPHQFSQSPNVTRLGVYGMGGSASPLLPANSDDSSVVVYQSNVSACPNNGPAIATFLILNITMTKGLYKYVNNFNQGIQIGFQPTCSNLGCLLSSSATGGVSTCIGDEGRQNCATCVSIDTVNQNDIKIWASYYGTDAKSRILTSGGQNPLAFRQFAASPVVDTVFTNIQNLTNSL